MFEFLDSLFVKRDVLRPRDISEPLGYKPGVVSTWVKRGILPKPFLAIGSKVRVFDRKSVIAALAKHLTNKQGVSV